MVPNDQKCFDTLILEWNELQGKLAELKKQEMEMRKELIARTFNVNSIGTQNYELGNGYKLKAVIKESTSLTSTRDVEEVISKLSDQLKYTLFEKKYSLSNKVLKTLNDEERKMVEAVIVRKPAAPSLELVLPKGAL